MAFSVVPYSGGSHGFSPMKPWPALAGKAFCLTDDKRPAEKIFFYDSAPLQSSASFNASALLRNPTPSGSSPPLFVLIHGLGDEADTWRYIVPLLNSRGFRVLALDLPGFGRSVTAGRINLKAHTRSVLKLIDAALSPMEAVAVSPMKAGAAGGTADSRPGPVFIAGNSMGAVIAEEIALKRPGLVLGLALIDGSIPGGPRSPGLIPLAVMLFSRKWYRAYRGNPEAAWASLKPYYANLEGMPAEDRSFLHERVMARVESRSQEQAFFASQKSLVWAYMCAGGTASSRFTRGIMNYSGKILLLWGEKDIIVPLSTAHAVKKLRGDIELKVIPGTGHLPHQENPAETARLMADFAENVL